MCASVALFALAGFLVNNVPASPSWHTDYLMARKLGKEDRKPLAVFIGSGKGGWNQLSREGKLSSKISELLAAEYVCVYVDASRVVGKRLASEFEVADGVGLVLSDRTRAVQAFRHEGDLTETELLRQLKRYADPERVVRTTETSTVERASYYAPEAPATYEQPRAYYRSFSSGRC
jgi:hypothetical protein